MSERVQEPAIESADPQRAWMGVITPYAFKHVDDTLACLRMLAPKFTETTVVVADGWQAYAGDSDPDIVKANIARAKEEGARLARGLTEAISNIPIQNVAVHTTSQMRKMLNGSDTIKNVKSLDETSNNHPDLQRDLRDVAILQLGHMDQYEWRAHYAQLQVELTLRLARAGISTKIALLDDDHAVDGVTAKLLSGGYKGIQPERLDFRSIYTRPQSRLVRRRKPS